MEKPPSAYEIFYQLFVKQQSNFASGRDEALFATQLWGIKPTERAYAQELHKYLMTKYKEQTKVQNKNPSNKENNSYIAAQIVQNPQESKIIKINQENCLNNKHQILIKPPQIVLNASNLQKFYLIRHMDEYYDKYQQQLQPSIRIFSTIDVLFQTLTNRELKVVEQEYAKLNVLERAQVDEAFELQLRALNLQ
ncbi:Hypothetical_protein [Hexamita inflata]|uniref:Hypothetical_protein n=1 Tax=Hexamita inflata TaxID=28002 RepID=A0ABP1I9U2_9EUKA